MSGETSTLFNPSPQGSRSVLSVVGSGRQIVRRVISGRILSEHCLVLVESGEGLMWSRSSGAAIISGPAIIFLIGGSEHTYGPNQSTAWKERWALFRGALANEFIRDSFLLPQNPVLGLQNPTGVQQIFSDVHSGLRRGGKMGAMQSSLALHTLLVRLALLERQMLAGGASSFFESVIRELQNRAFEEINLQALANEFDIATSTLRRKCIELTGMSPKRLQIAVRLSRAKELLSETDMSVSEIAEKAGFADYYYFSRIFSSRNNCSPSEFRRLHRRH